MKFIFVFIFLTSALFSEDVLTFYKSGGKKLIDSEMGKPSYWASYIMNKDLRFGYFERAVSLLACSKEKGALELYTPNAQQQFSLKKRYSALTGKNPGDKNTRGDLRTPIGVYTFTEKKKNVDPFYGPMAFVTSYPNLYDRIRGKDGDGIWVHGVPSNGTRDPFTKGCIAINNNDLIQLDQTINPYNTVLIIDTSIKQSVTPSAYSSILSALFQWKYAWTYNDIDSYLSFYDPAFKRYDGMSFERFKTYKERIFNKDEEKTITFSNFTIIPYPGEKKNLYWVAFHQVYTSESHRFEGEKSILLRLNPDQSIAILTEE